MKIAQKENADELVCGAAALLHDLNRVMEAKTGKYVSDKESLPEVEKVLHKTEFPEEKIPLVLEAIANKKSRKFSVEGVKEQSLNAKILSDADQLEAIGAIGIARCFSYSEKNKRPFYIEGEDLKDRIYVEKDKSTSAIRHFYDKLLKLKDNMKTETGKKMAVERHKFLEEFLKHFFKEWKEANNEI